MSTRFSVFIAISIDGYIARNDGGLDWLSRVELPGEDYGYAKFMASVDTLVLGRSTYDTVLGFGEWPYAGKNCVVLTNRQSEPVQGERFFAGDVRELAKQLQLSGARRVYVDGGKVIQQFLAADLLDSLTLSVIPVALGSGIPLFAPQDFTESGRERGFKLEGARGYDSGLVQLQYARQRDPG